jgi:hypothetical protein
MHYFCDVQFNLETSLQEILSAEEGSKCFMYGLDQTHPTDLDET